MPKVPSATVLEDDLSDDTPFWLQHNLRADAGRDFFQDGAQDGRNGVLHEILLEHMTRFVKTTTYD